jgi:PPK2 family polyphosphate:nucleotide phosphotransferase
MDTPFNLADHLVTDGPSFRLKDHATSLPGKPAKDDLKKLAKKDAKRIGELQELLYAERERSLLLIFQAMDAAGKDSCLKRVLRYVSPQGCAVTSYKAPGPLERAHDFLWRHAMAAPAKGIIGVHNRSHYEEVLVVKVHPEFLPGQGLPGIRTVKDADADFWDARYESIRGLESHLVRQGTVVLKFFLHMGLEAQKERFLDRIEDRAKNWKFNPQDLKERALWKEYMNAYESAIRATATPQAPWFVVPADRQWESRAIVCRIVREQLEAMEPKLPAVGREERRAMAEAAKQLAAK